MATRSAHKLTTDETNELQQILGRRPDVLVLGRGPQGFVALLRDRMVVRHAQGWQLVAWTDIQRGGWNSDTNKLRWELVDGSRGEAILDEPAGLPHAFAERVRASIVVARQFDLDDDLGTVQVVGRRRPGSDDPISWQAEGLGRCDLTDPKVGSLVLDLVEQMRVEYE